MALINFVTFVVLKILTNLVSMQSSLNVDEISKTVQDDLTFILYVLLE